MDDSQRGREAVSMEVVTKQPVNTQQTEELHYVLY
jgi:hypothetical protein